VGSNDWTTVGMTPDERHLLVTTLFGGVASGCTRWEGWEVDESEERVDVRALVWRKSFPSGCTDEGVIETIEVDLNEPLGTRDLVGCGKDDCRSLEPESWFGSWEVDAVTSQAGVVVANAGVLWSFGNDGAVLWNHDPGTTELLKASFDDVVAYDGQTTKAYDPLSGAETWQADGFIAAVDEETVYVCRGGDADLLAAVDSETGTEQWQENLPCGYLVVRGDVITIVAVDREVDGGHELLLVDSSTGAVILREKLDDGIDDQVNGFEGVVLAGDRVVIAGHQADLVVLGGDAEELIRRPVGLGTPIGVVDDLVIIAGHDRVAAIDPTTGETAWESQTLSRDSLAVSDDSLWSLDALTGSVSRLDPETGDPLWTTAVGLTSGFDVAANLSTAYVATSLAMIALDSSTGEVKWWQHVRFEQP
jgi:outer membrane protein assembly factor BamB